MLGWIELKVLRCSGRHGVNEQERITPRPFVLDVAVHLDVGAAAESDDLIQAIDLAALAETACGVIRGPSRALLETLAVHVAREVLGRFAMAEDVRVRVA